MSDIQSAGQRAQVQSCEETSQRVQSLLRQAEASLIEGNFPNANHLYAEILAADPTNAAAKDGRLEVLLRWGYSDLARQCYDKAHHHFTDAHKLDPSSVRAKEGQVESLVQWGNQDLEHGRVDEARHLYTRAIQTDPQCAAARIQLRTIAGTLIADIPPSDSHLHIDPNKPPTAIIRELLEAAFTAKTLERFCRDRIEFKDLVTRFSPSDSLADMVEKVIAYCGEFLLWDELLAGVKEFNPRQYARFAGQLSPGGELARAAPSPAAQPGPAPGGATYTVHIQHAQGIAIGDGARVITGKDEQDKNISTRRS